MLKRLVRNLKRNNRLVQGVLHDRFDVDWLEVDKLNDTERAGGFGSTGA